MKLILVVRCLPLYRRFAALFLQISLRICHFMSLALPVVLLLIFILMLIFLFDTRMAPM